VEEVALVGGVWGRFYGWFGFSDGWRISCWSWLRPKAAAPKSPLSAIAWGQGLGRIASCIGLPLQGIPHSKPIVNSGLISFAVPWW